MATRVSVTYFVLIGCSETRTVSARSVHAFTLEFAIWRSVQFSSYAVNSSVPANPSPVGSWELPKSEEKSGGGVGRVPDHFDQTNYAEIICILVTKYKIHFETQ